MSRPSLTSITKDINTYLSNYTSNNTIYNNSFKILDNSNIIKLKPNFLYYLVDLKLLNCSICLSIIIPTYSSIKKHLKEKHKVYNYNNKDLDLIVNKILEKDYIKLEDFKDLTIKPLEFYYNSLPLELNTYKCLECFYISSSRKLVKKHLIEKHNIKEANTNKSNNILENIPSLVLKGYSNYKLYFIPKLPTLDLETSNKFNSSNNSSNNTSSIKSIYNKELEEYFLEEEINKEKNNNNNYKDINFRDLNYFNKETNYYKFIINKDIKELLSLIDTTILKEDSYIRFLYNLVIEIGEDYTTKIESLSRIIRLTIYNIDLRNTNTTSIFKVNSSKTSRRDYFKEYSLLLLFLYNSYNSTNKDNNNYFKDTNYNSLLEILFKSKKREFYNSKLEESKFKETLVYIILRLFTKLLKEPIDITSLESNTTTTSILRFFIIRSINKSSLTFNKESTIENLLDKLLYNSKYFFLAYIINKTSISSNRSIEYRFNKKSYLFKKDSTNYYIEFFLLKKALKKYNSNTSNTKNIFKNIDNTTIKLVKDNLIINKDILEDYFKSILTKVEDLLYKELLLFTIDKGNIDTIIDLKLYKIEDNREDTNNLFSLLDNNYLKEYTKSSLNRLYSTNSSLYKVVRKSNNTSINLKLVKEYLLKRDLFIKYLYLAIYLLSSSPLRVEELARITYKNTIDKGLRNIIYNKENKLVSINTKYSKTSNKDNSKISKDNIRFIPNRLTKVIIYYITLVVPLVTYFRKKIINNKEDTSYLLEIDLKPIKSSIISNLLATTSREYFSKGLTIEIYRQSILYFIFYKIVKDKRYLLTPRKNRDNYTKSIDRIEDILANHSLNRREISYTRSYSFDKDKTLSIYLRSLKFSYYYFNYFNLLEDKSIRNILIDNSNTIKIYISSSNNSSTNRIIEEIENSIEDTYKEISNKRYNKSSTISNYNNIIESNSIIETNSSYNSSIKEILAKNKNNKLEIPTISNIFNSTLEDLYNIESTKSNNTTIESIKSKSITIEPTIESFNTRIERVILKDKDTSLSSSNIITYNKTIPSIANNTKVREYISNLNTSYKPIVEKIEDNTYTTTILDSNKSFTSSSSSSSNNKDLITNFKNKAINKKFTFKSTKDNIASSSKYNKPIVINSSSSSSSSISSSNNNFSNNNNISITNKSRIESTYSLANLFTNNTIEDNIIEDNTIEDNTIKDNSKITSSNISKRGRPKKYKGIKRTKNLKLK